MASASTTSQTNTQGRSRRRRRQVVLGLLIVIGLGAVAIFRRPLFEGNFGVVDPGLVYRSAQPTADLPRLIRAYRLAAVLNLRGGSPSDSWYASEVRLTRENAVVFYDLPLNATQRPTRRDLIRLLDLFDRTPYPLLIHCKQGSDRTGLAAALYVLSRRGESPAQALRAFSIGYGHVALGGPAHLHEPFLEYGAWLQSHGLSHTPTRFRTWVEQVYRADDQATDIPPLEPGPRTNHGRTKRS
jgi:hypothetical protein